jgi:hypothetical protein
MDGKTALPDFQYLKFSGIFLAEGWKSPPDFQYLQFSGVVLAE